MDIVIIPAFNPDHKLIALIQELQRRETLDIIVVNDGSAQTALTIFNQLESVVTILTHRVNLGKGEAIKTALRHVTAHMPKVDGIVLMDADGQHRPEDAIRLLEQLHIIKTGMVLGVRRFEGKIPVRSLFGNTVTRYVFRFISGIWVSDTQTGLRAFAPDMIPMLLEVNGERYEYEMNVLLALAKSKTPITEIPIETIYEDKKNSCSHFRAIRDSARIYSNLLLFSGVSLVSFLLDYLLFFPMIWAFSLIYSEPMALIYGNITARIISSLFNYYLNSKFVFKNVGNRLKSGFHYALLAILILILNTVILSNLRDVFHIPKAFAKLFTELLLFFLSFTVQKFFIFRKKSKKH